MKKITLIRGLAVPLPDINIDTDAIIPKQFLKTVKRTGLGQYAFYDRRFLHGGSLNPDFVLNKKAYYNATILLCGANFGCGSSREHAPWALMDYGLQAIIAPSFAEIFQSNCYKNGLLAITLPEPTLARLMKDAENGFEFEINLEKQTLRSGNNREISFPIDPFRKECLLHGYDDIELTLKHKNELSEFEKEHKSVTPWL